MHHARLRFFGGRGDRAIGKARATAYTIEESGSVRRREA